jgi:uncharacterized protein with HEPN domain
MRRERLYLLDIVEAADAIRSFLAGVSESAFLGNDLLRSAVLQKLSIIGEAASRLPQDLCDRHPEIDWRGLAGFRNIAIHAYFAVEWPIVWVAATEETPALRERVAAILAEDPPRDEAPFR